MPGKVGNCRYNSYSEMDPNDTIVIIEPADDNETCATSEDSDQYAHPHSLIRVFADRMCLLQTPGYPKRDEQELLPY